MNAEIISVDKICIDERNFLKCRFGCPYYLTNMMCPPYVPSIVDFGKLIRKYKWAIIIECNLAEKKEDAKAFSIKLNHLVLSIESEASKQGFHYALGLSAGPCMLCDECVCLSNDLTPCRDPIRARPSMESSGISVFETVKNCTFKVISTSGYCMVLLV